ncbi:MAG TPA: CHC2 zinc finger domain-containing protein [Ktedonobacteraceae bacterium]
MNLYELISQNTSLRRVAATNGGEYAGPCPFCGGKDRFRVWPDSDRPGFWCRGCGKRGDAIQYLRERDGLTFQEAQAQLTSGALFEEALATTSVKKAKPKNVKPASPLSDDGSPSWEWQTEAKILCRLACRTLWSPEGSQARTYLYRRGLNDETIRKALLGYLPEATSATAQAWGFASDEKRVWQPAGIIIPWIVDKSIWGIRIRSVEQGDMYRYIQIRGSRNALYRAGSIRPDTPAVLVEGEFDALSIAQQVGDTIAVVASGSTEGAHPLLWQAHLAMASHVLVAFDADDAGDKAAQWWLQRLDNARRWRPCWEDSNSLLQHDFALRTWVELGLRQ